MTTVPITALASKKVLVFVSYGEEEFIAWRSLFEDLLCNNFIVMWTSSLSQMPKGFNICGVLVMSWLHKYSFEIERIKLNVPFIIYLQTSEFDGVPKSNVTEVMHLGQINSKVIYDTVSKYV